MIALCAEDPRFNPGGERTLSEVEALQLVSEDKTELIELMV